MGKTHAKKGHTDTLVEDREIENRNRETLRIIQEWIKDDSGYDEKVWPTVKKNINENRLSLRPRFREQKNPS